LQQFLGLFLSRGLVDDEGAAVVGERSRRGELAAFLQAGQVLPVDRTHLGDFRLVLDVFDDGREFHGIDSFGKPLSPVGERGWGGGVRCSPTPSPPTPLPRSGGEGRILGETFTGEGGA